MINQLNKQFAIPGAVAIMAGKKGMPKVVLTHPNGDRAVVYLHGGQVTAWSAADGRDLLFLSQASQFAPEKAIRGGIPVIFPQFGGGALPQHGFARNSDWQLRDTKVYRYGQVEALFELTESEQTLSLWPYRFKLALNVWLSVNTLKLHLTVTNTGDRPFSFTTALHSYFAVADIEQTAVLGLQGVEYIDSLRENIREVEQREAIRFDQEIDRIYLQAANSQCINDAGNHRTITIAHAGLEEVVVWNPWVAKAARMADFGDDEYRSMLCVETGAMTTPIILSPEIPWEGMTTLTAQENSEF